MMNRDNSQNFLSRIHQQFFYSNSALGLSVVVVFLLAVAGYALFDWGVLRATFRADASACHEFGGACWGFVTEKWRLIIFGRYPYELQWRPCVATLAIIGMLIVTACPQLWNKRGSRILMAGWTAAMGVFFVLMMGGVFGLSSIDTDNWGGFPLTVILTLLGMTVSVPIGILLALGRRSAIPCVRYLSIGYIELVRGVPLITVLFVASFIFPLLLPSGIRIEAFWRVAGGIILFQSAYMAETVRGGLQTVGNGQMLAAQSLGMKSWQVYGYIILPQALVAIIPAFVNSLLSTFMDTSLVTVVSMYDITGALALALGDANWRDFFREGYIFIAAIYFVCSFLMSRYSQWLEKRLAKSKNMAQ